MVRYDRRQLRGSPAHAGIDPDEHYERALLPGFPRTRGDRPLHPDTGDLIMSVPPHTRG